MKINVIIGMNLIAMLLIVFYFSNHSSTYQTKEIIKSKTVLTESQKYKQWSISKLSESLANLKLNQLNFMDEKSMKGTYIELKKGESLKRKAETDDIYYLYSGSSSAKYSNGIQSFDKGDVIYVKKGSGFMIDDIKEPLKIVLVSMTLSSDSQSIHSKHFSKSDIASSRENNENVWNPFIMYSNVIFGMYMLPHSIDGDNRLIHPWQEINIITSGSSQFIMDTDSITVEEGSIVFVEEGNGHYFDALKKDLDILILWEQRNVAHADH